MRALELHGLHKLVNNLMMMTEKAQEALWKHKSSDFRVHAALVQLNSKMWT